MGAEGTDGGGANGNRPDAGSSNWTQPDPWPLSPNAQPQPGQDQPVSVSAPPEKNDDDLGDSLEDPLGGEPKGGHPFGNEGLSDPASSQGPAQGVRKDHKGLLLGWRPLPRTALFSGAMTKRQEPEDDNRDDQSFRLRGDMVDPVLYEGDSHLLTVAPTGSGKGRGAIIPNLLRYGGPMIVVDPKGENFHVTARYRRALGQRVYVLDPFGMVTGYSDRLNPFDVFRLPNSQIDADSEMLAELLAGGVLSLKDPFWDISASSLIAGLIAYIATTKHREDRHFGHFRSLLWSDFVYQIAKLLDERGDLHPFVRAELEGFLGITADMTRGGILATAFTHAHVLKSDAVLACLGESTIDLNAVIRGDPMTLYLIIPPTKLDSHRALLRLWIGTLLLAIMQRRSRPAQRTVFLLDECAQLGSLGVLRQAVTLMRGYGLQIWMFFQDLSQLKRLYPDDWQTMVNNAAVLQTFGLNTHLVAREMSDLIGGISPLDLRTMPVRDQVCVMPGSETILSRRPDYLEDPMFEGRFDPNPLFNNRGRSLK